VAANVSECRARVGGGEGKRTACVLGCACACARILTAKKIKLIVMQ